METSNMQSTFEPDVVGMWTRTAGARCQKNLLAFLDQVQSHSFPARRDTSYSLRTNCGDQFGHVAVTTAIADYDLSDFSRTVPSDARAIESARTSRKCAYRNRSKSGGVFLITTHYTE